MTWYSAVRETIRRELAEWRDACGRFERLVTRASGEHAATQEIDDVAAEISLHVETLATAVRDLKRADRLDREKRMARSAH